MEGVDDMEFCDLGFKEKKKEGKMSKEKLKEKFESLGGETALDTAKDIIEWYISYLEEFKSQAWKTIDSFKAVRDEFPIDAEFLDE